MSVVVAQKRLAELASLVTAGADDTRPPELGPPVVLWRQFRDGTETEECLPEMLAEWTLIGLAVGNEPDVARAKIIRFS